MDGRSELGLPKCYKTLEEALKSWHYFVSDRVVYVDKLFVGNDDPFACVSELNVDLHRWLELDVWFGTEVKTDLTAVICPIGDRRHLGGMAQLELDPGRLKRNATVLVDIPEPMESPELRGLVGIPCMVWLECVNYAHGGRRDAFHRTLKQASPVGIIHANYGN